MIYVILLGIVVIASGVIFYLFFSVKKDQKHQILANLGLRSGLSATVKSPFYKWAWRKKSGDRVWGERIVREAFDSAHVGLSPDDLEFFKQACEKYAKGDTVNKSEILGRIDEIYKRSSSVSNIAIDYIRPNLDEALNQPPNHARAILAKLGIQSTKDTAQGRLATYKFNQVLTKIGAAILQPGSSGYDIKDKNGQPVLTLKGLEGLEQWLQAAQAGAKQYIDNSLMVKKTGTTRFLKIQVLKNVVERYLDDLKESQNFVRQLSQTFSQNEISIDEVQIKQLAKSLYYWHLSDFKNFSLKQLQQVREFFLKSEYSPHFREKVFLNLDEKYDSLTALVKKFPLHVIFYGKNKEAREYATQQYTLHVFYLQNFISEVSGIKPQSPMIVRVIESELEKARRGELSLVTNETLKESDRIEEDNFHEEQQIEDTGHLPLLLNLYKQRALFDKNLDPKVMANVGWIIEIPIEDFTPKEHAQLDISNYMFYKRINCDKTGNPNFDQDSNASLIQRQKYFGEILKGLVDT